MTLKTCFSVANKMSLGLSGGQSDCCDCGGEHSWRTYERPVARGFGVMRWHASRKACNEALDTAGACQGSPMVMPARGRSFCVQDCLRRECFYSGTPPTSSQTNKRISQYASIITPKDVHYKTNLNPLISGGVKVLHRCVLRDSTFFFEPAGRRLNLKNCSSSSLLPSPNLQR